MVTARVWSRPRTLSRAEAAHYRGDDDVVDDEFMRYFDFLLEVCDSIRLSHRPDVRHGSRCACTNEPREDCRRTGAEGNNPTKSANSEPYEGHHEPTANRFATGALRLTAGVRQTLGVPVPPGIVLSDAPIGKSAAALRAVQCH